MPYFTNSNCRIVGIAASVPKDSATEKDFVEQFGNESVQKFVKSTGIHAVHRANIWQTAGDLGYAAAESLLKKLSFPKEKIGVLIFVSQSPDYRRPATACVLQNRLGLGIDCSAIDVGLGCSGFVYGHNLMHNMLANSDSDYGLLILGETASKLVNPNDKSIAMMYGDAGAAILYHKEPVEQRLTLLQSDGYRFKSIILPAGGFREMYPGHEKYVCSDGIERSKYDIYMNGLDVFSFSTTDVPNAIKNYLGKTQSNAKDYDLVVLHQANIFILKQISRRIGADFTNVPVSLDRYGNTGGISIPLTLCDALNGKVGKKNVLVSGFGIGLSWGVSSFEIDCECVQSVIEYEGYYEDGIICPGDL